MATIEIGAVLADGPEEGEWVMARMVGGQGIIGDWWLAWQVGKEVFVPARCGTEPTSSKELAAATEELRAMLPEFTGSDGGPHPDDLTFYDHLGDRPVIVGLEGSRLAVLV